MQRVKMRVRNAGQSEVRYRQIFARSIGIPLFGRVVSVSGRGVWSLAGGTQSSSVVSSVNNYENTNEHLNNWIEAFTVDQFSNE